MADRYNQISSVNYTMYINSCYTVLMRGCFQLILDEPISKVGKVPANKHICHASGIYWDILANNGKYWQI